MISPCLCFHFVVPLFLFCVYFISTATSVNVCMTALAPYFLDLHLNKISFGFVVHMNLIIGFFSSKASKFNEVKSTKWILKNCTSGLVLQLNVHKVY